MTVVLANDKQRRLDDEPEVAVLERAPMLLTHKKADEARVLVPQLVGRLVEGDACAVDDREVRGQRAVERDEAVIQDRNDVLR